MANARNGGAGPSRRGLLAGATGAAAALPLIAAAAPRTHRPPKARTLRMDMTLRINGRDHHVALDPRCGDFGCAATAKKRPQMLQSHLAIV